MENIILNPYEPPKAKLNTDNLPKQSILLTVLAVMLIYVAQYIAGYIVAPRFAGLFTGTMPDDLFFYGGESIDYFADAAATYILYIFVFTVAAIVRSTHQKATVYSVASIMWVYYFWEVGFLDGIINSYQPTWYEINANVNAYISAFVALKIARIYKNPLKTDGDKATAL